MTSIRIAIVAGAALLAAACNSPGDERTFDTTRPETYEPVPSAAPDSTTGVAAPTGRPGVAGPVRTKDDNISAPIGKSADPRRQ